MKAIPRLILFIVVAVIGIALLVFAFTKMRGERDNEAGADTAVVAPSHVENSPGQGPVLKLDAETQKRLGMQTAVPVDGSIAKEIVVTSRVLDPAALSTSLNELRSAQAALAAARADYERKKKLFETGQNASASALEQADAAAKQQVLAVGSAQDHLAATWGKVIAKRDDLDALVRTLLQREAALVRVDLLPSDKLDGEPSGVRLLRQSGEEIATAHVLERAPSVDLPTIGQSFLCLVDSNASELIAGTVLSARLDTGAKESGVVIPRSAILRHSGLGWTYVQTGAETFTRRVVPLERPHRDGWLVSGEWTQPVVVAGAQSLLSEELKGSIQMEQ